MGNVLFDPGKAALTSTAKGTHDNIAGSLSSQNLDNEIRIERYTVSDPIRKSYRKTNERLSAERELAVPRDLEREVADTKILGLWNHMNRINKRGKPALVEYLA